VCLSEWQATALHLFALPGASTVVVQVVRGA
jgi:hypothetical protein